MPKLPVSKEKRLGPIFGLPLSSLEDDHLPKKNEIVKFWMYCYELKRGDSWILKEEERRVVRNEVKYSLNSEKCQKVAENSSNCRKYLDQHKTDIY